MTVRAQPPVASTPVAPTNPAANEPPGAGPLPGTTPPSQARRSVFDAIGDFFKGIGDAIVRAFTNNGQDTLQHGRTPGEIGAESIRPGSPIDTRGALREPLNRLEQTQREQREGRAQTQE